MARRYPQSLATVAVIHLSVSNPSGAEKYVCEAITIKITTRSRTVVREVSADYVTLLPPRIRRLQSATRSEIHPGAALITLAIGEPGVTNHDIGVAIAIYIPHRPSVSCMGETRPGVTILIPHGCRREAARGPVKHVDRRIEFIKDKIRVSISINIPRMPSRGSSPLVAIHPIVAPVNGRR